MNPELKDLMLTIQAWVNLIGFSTGIIVFLGVVVYLVFRKGADGK